MAIPRRTKTSSTSADNLDPTWIKPPPGKKKLMKSQVLSVGEKTLSAKEAESLLLWPAVRLRVDFDPAFAFRYSQGKPWHDAAVDMAMKLAGLVSPTFIVENIADKSTEAVLEPKAFTKALARQLLERVIFKDRKHIPWVVLRSGEELSAVYERSLLATDKTLSVFLPPTPANAALLVKTLDDLVGGGRAAFSEAGVGFALAGWASILAADSATTLAPAYTRAAKIAKAEASTKALGAEWVVWIGERMSALESTAKLVDKLLETASAGRTVRKEGPRARIQVAAPKSPDDSAGAKQARQLQTDMKALLKKVQAKLSQAADVKADQLQRDQEKRWAREDTKKSAAKAEKRKPQPRT